MKIEAWNLVTEMMELDVSKRIKIEDIYNHKWMKLEENKKSIKELISFVIYF